MATQHFIFQGKEYTLREMQVISLNSLGLTQQQIAAYLGCSEGTVKTHLKTIRIKRACNKEESSSRKLMSDSLTNGFNPKGYYLDFYLFSAYPIASMPWGEA